MEDIYRWVPGEDPFTRFEIVGLFIGASVLSWIFLAGFSFRPYITAILFVLGVIIFLDDLQKKNIIRYTGGETRFWMLLMAPGTIIHEFSHYLACLLSGVYVTEASFFKPNPKTGTLGYVRYEIREDKWIFLRKFIISMAPFFGGGLLAWLLFSYVTAVPVISLEGITTIDMVINTIAGAFMTFLGNLFTINLLDPVNLIVLYFAFTVGFGSAPSTHDFKDIIEGISTHLVALLIGVVVIGALVFLDLTPLYNIFLNILMISLVIFLISIPLTYIMEAVYVFVESYM
jgi:hypothetical protein